MKSYSLPLTVLEGSIVTMMIDYTGSFASFGWSVGPN